MKILYAGDSPAGGPANYLLGILKYLKAATTHIPPSVTLRPSVLKKRFDAIILSDFSRADLPRASEKLMAEQVEAGTGLLMVGGWGSFSGPFGKWRGSAIEKLLPVSCFSRDDRRNVASGLMVIKKQNHPILRGSSFNQSPVICGLNEVRVKSRGKIILVARKIVGVDSKQRHCEEALQAPTKQSSNPEIASGAMCPRNDTRLTTPLFTLDNKEYPLLVVDCDPVRRIAAFTTDFAPHWCGGLVDWGNERRTLSVTNKIHIEVGSTYVGFIASVLRWLTRK